MSNGCVWREVTDPIRPSYSVDLAVKSLPLCILEHCWSFQIIRKTRGAYPSNTRSPHRLFILGYPSILHPLFVASAGTCTHSSGLWSACARNFAKEGGHVSRFCVVLYGGELHYGLHCLVIMAWCAYWQVLRCKELCDCIINEASGK